MRRKKIIHKPTKKKYDQKCCFCSENNYNVLDVHRIIPGEQNGKYTEYNSITVCCKCHRLIHSGEITIDKKYPSTSGKWVIHYWHNDEEKWT